jgi:pimeloyl-ACP methyl ester carboxylesterase
MEEMRQVVRFAVEHGPEAFVAQLGEEPRVLSGETQQRMRERMLAWDYEAMLTAFQDRESLEAVLPTMRVPCLLYAGDRDEVYALVRECAAHLVDVTCVTLPGLDHMQVLMRSGELLPHVKRFLSAVDQRAGASGGVW